MIPYKAQLEEKQLLAGQVFFILSIVYFSIKAYLCFFPGILVSGVPKKLKQNKSKSKS